MLKKCVIRSAILLISFSLFLMTGCGNPSLVDTSQSLGNPNDTTTTDTNLTVTQLSVDSGTVSSILSITDQNGDPILGLTPASVKVEETLDDTDFTKSATSKSITTTTITFTSIQDSGKAIETVLTMDYSGSMSSQNIDDMEEASKLFLGFFRSTDLAAVIKFAAGVISEPLAGLTSDIASLITYIDTGAGSLNTGSTSLYDAVYTGMETLNAASGTGLKALIAFTDGQDNNSSYTKQNVIDYSNNNNIPIYSLGFGSADQMTLEDMATSGIYEYVSDSSDLAALYNQIAQRIQYSYMLQWDTIGQPGETVYVRITITYLCAQGTLVVEQITSYTA